MPAHQSLLFVETQSSVCKRDKAELETALLVNRPPQPSWLELTCGFTEAGREGCIEYVFGGSGSALMLVLQPNVELSCGMRRAALAWWHRMREAHCHQDKAARRSTSARAMG